MGNISLRGTLANEAVLAARSLNYKISTEPSVQSSPTRTAPTVLRLRGARAPPSPNEILPTARHCQVGRVGNVGIV